MVSPHVLDMEDLQIHQNHPRSPQGASSVERLKPRHIISITEPEPDQCIVVAKLPAFDIATREASSSRRKSRPLVVTLVSLALLPGG